MDIGCPYILVYWFSFKITAMRRSSLIFFLFVVSSFMEREECHDYTDATCWFSSSDSNTFDAAGYYLFP